MERLEDLLGLLEGVLEKSPPPFLVLAFPSATGSGALTCG